MKNKAFTLIELLAVIVILAIIALIATPIILGIINSTREEARKRSAEAVSHAVETAYIQTAMKAETNGSASLNNENVIGNTKIDNERSRTATSITTNDGVTCTLSSSFILTCTYGNDTDPLINPKDVKNGTEVVEVVKSGPDWYSRLGSINGNLPADKTNDPSTFEEAFYLGLDTEDGTTVSAAYVCFVTDKEYCLQGGVEDADIYASNQAVLLEAFPSCNTFSDTDSSCSGDDFYVNVYLDGAIDVSDGGTECHVNADSSFGCM